MRILVHNQLVRFPVYLCQLRSGVPVQYQQAALCAEDNQRLFLKEVNSYAHHILVFLTFIVWFVVIKRLYDMQCCFIDLIHIGCLTLCQRMVSSSQLSSVYKHGLVISKLTSGGAYKRSAVYCSTRLGD